MRGKPKTLALRAVFEERWKSTAKGKEEIPQLESMATATDAIEEMIGRPIRVDEIDDDLLLKFEKHLRGAGYSWRVRKRRRRCIELIRDSTHHRSEPAKPKKSSKPTLRQYVTNQLGKILPKAGAYFQRQAELAVDALCIFLEHEVALEDVSPEMLIDFESCTPNSNYHAERLRRVMRTIDPVAFRLRSRPLPGPSEPQNANCWLLWNLFEQHFVPHRLRSKTENAKRVYRCTLRSFNRFLGRQAVLADLNDETVNAFAVRRLQDGMKRGTVNRDLWNILAFWRWCCDKGYVDQRPDVTIEPEITEVPVAWEESEIRRLIAHLRTLEGTVGAFAASDWWLALHLLLWDTGERIGAVMQLQWSQVDLRRQWVRFPAGTRKGQREGSAATLSKETVEALERIRSGRGPVFPWPFNQSRLWYVYGQILEQAGLPNDRMSKFHRIRKTVASYVEAAGGNATAVLRHSDRRVTEKYLDPRITKPQQPVDVLFRLGKA